MDQKSQAYFDKLLTKLSQKEHLIKEEIAFLRARRSYLTSSQKVIYADILYLNKQYLIQKLVTIGKWLVTVFLFQIIINIIVELAKNWLTQ